MSIFSKYFRRNTLRQVTIIVVSHLVYGSFKVAEQTVFMDPEVVGVYDLGRDFALACRFFHRNNCESDFSRLIVLSLTAL